MYREGLLGKCIPRHTLQLAEAMIYMMVVEDGKYILTQKAYEHLIECKGCFGRPFFIFLYGISQDWSPCELLQPRKIVNYNEMMGIVTVSR